MARTQVDGAWQARLAALTAAALRVTRGPVVWIAERGETAEWHIDRPVRSHWATLLLARHGCRDRMMRVSVDVDGYTPVSRHLYTHLLRALDLPPGLVIDVLATHGHIAASAIDLGRWAVAVLADDRYLAAATRTIQAAEKRARVRESRAYLDHDDPGHGTYWSDDDQEGSRADGQKC
jgi:hypothetical protein